MGRVRELTSKQTIRGQLTRIVVIPSLCFLLLWLVVAAAGTFRAGSLMLSIEQSRTGFDAVDAAAAALSQERRLSLVHLGERPGSAATARALREQREATDAAFAAALPMAEKLRSTGDDEVRRGAAAFTEDHGALEEIREAVDTGGTDRATALFHYSQLVEGARGLTASLLRTLDGDDHLSDTVLARDLLDAREDFAQADALLAGAIAQDSMSYEETAHFTYLTASYRSALADAEPVMHTAIRDRYAAMTDTDQWRAAEEFSRAVVTREPVADPGQAGAGWNDQIQVAAAEWDGSSARALVRFDDLTAAQVDHAVSLAWNAALLRVSLGVAGGLLTLAAGITAIVAVGRSSRRLTDRLCRLREETLNRSKHTLPEIVDRVRRGHRVDVAEALPRLDHGPDEIGQVADAFDTAQQAAVAATVKQAEIRRGVSRVFLSIAYRNQTLVQRQLRLLDEIEYDEEDPVALRKLFRLDHLTTRARRYADNLIILGGGQSSRRWGPARPMVDVLRAAISETEGFDRVRLTSAPHAMLTGQAVADIVHLIAELVENATQFSPTGSPVEVNCGPVAGGLAVDVEDRGLGMSEQGLAAAQRILSQVPEFDVMALPDEPRLGLFVVARLADRHGVQVRLYPSPYGGTRATAIIPARILEPTRNAAPLAREVLRTPGGADGG